MLRYLGETKPMSNSHVYHGKLFFYTAFVRRHTNTM